MLLQPGIEHTDPCYQDKKHLRHSDKNTCLSIQYIKRNMIFPKISSVLLILLVTLLQSSKIASSSSASNEKETSSFCHADDNKDGGCGDGAPAKAAFRDVVFDEALNDYDQDDPRLVEFIRDKILVGPSPPEVPYDFPRPSFPHSGFIAAQYGQPTVVDE